MSQMTTISKGGLTATIDSMGAQLTSLALDGREYLWQADSRWWGKHAPILFPIVGRLRNNHAESAAGPCNMLQHGVARINEHKLVSVSEDGTSATFELTDTPETREAYPYAFKLNMTYTITGPATLSQTFTVTNTGDVDLPFSVGGHPAFNVPVPGGEEAGEEFEDYELRFAEPWTAVCPKLEDGLANPKDTFTDVVDTDKLALSRRCFRYDTMIFNHVPGNTISLVGKKTERGIKVDFPGFDFLGVWSAAPDAPFVALEPWTGHATLTTEDDVLEHKENITILAPGEVDERTFAITLL